ncbi:MAG: GAF domain-containing protein [Anaerolineales bacterium]|nr:GAF domain-containing protein [Anaerolineales bacterium]
MNTRRRILLLAIGIIGLSLLPFRVAAQAQTIRFERLTIEDGLSQNAILAIAQDTQGFLWFGTEDGLNKYDGYEFVVYKHDPDDPTSIVDSFISSLFVDRDGQLWIGTRSGLDRYDRASGTFIHYPQDTNDPSYLEGAWVISLYEDQQGTLWVGTEGGGLNGIDRATGSFSHYVHDSGDPTSLSENAVRVIFEDSKGRFWVGTHDGLDLFDRISGTFTHFKDTSDPEGLNINDISAIFEDHQGYLWIGTEEGGVSRLDPESGTFLHFQADSNDLHSLSQNRVRSIYVDRLGNLWIGTRNGLNLLPAESVSSLTENPHFSHYFNDPYDPTSLGSSAIWSIFEDQSGVMWFGTWGGGLSKYNRSTDRFRLYQHNPIQPNSLSDNMIWSIMEDSKGMVWVGTFNGGLNKLDRETEEIIVYRHDEADPESLLSDDVRTLLEDPSGMVWVGTAGGLDLFDPQRETFTHFTNDPDDPQSLSGNQVLVLIHSHSGEIWVGTRYDGVNRFDPSTGKFTSYRNDPEDPQSLSDDRVWALYEDQFGALWVGTLGGVNVLEPGSNQFIRYQHNPDDPDSLSSDSIFAFYEDSEGNMWVGTWGGGLNRFDRTTKKFEVYTEDDGLPNDTIYGIEADAEGHLWMSTNRGLSDFDPVNMTFQNYDKRDGLQDDEFNVGAHFKSTSGEFFFGGIGGFTAFYPGDIQQNPHAPEIVITTFYKYNEPVRHDLLPNEHIDLSYTDDFIAFEFAALDFYAPDNNQYAYMLEGFDQDWVVAGTRRYVSYTNLDGGEYVFRVKGSNSDGVWNEEGVSVSISVTPPIWETTWFQLVSIVVVAAIIFTGYRLRVRGIQARSRELEALVSERTQEIEQRRSELNALYLADEELFRHLEVDQVFEALVDIAVEILHADKGALLYWDDQASKLVVRASKGFKPETLERVEFGGGEGEVGWVMETGQPVMIHDVGEDPHVTKWITEAEGIHSLMHVPIKGEDKVYGVFNVDYVEPRGFGAEEQRLFEALAQRAAIAIEQAHLQDQARKTAVYEERQRLARDLHDAVTQTLFSASLVSEVLPSLWEKDPELGRNRLRVLNELTKGALAEMRTLLIELRPYAIEEAELEELIRQLAESTTGRARIPVDVEIEGECDLSPDEKVALYRVVQEALNNIAKHANASRVTVHILCDTSKVELCVEDDGVGFGSEVVPPDHLGLKIMRERAESIGAELSVESKPNEGTRIKLAWSR